MKKQPKKISNAKTVTRVVTLWLEPALIDRIKTKARKLNIPVNSLVTKYIAERVKK